MNKQLIEWDKISYRIANAEDIEEIKKIETKLEAFKTIARQTKQSLETMNRIGEYRLRLERTKGEWLEENVEHKGGNPQLLPEGTVKLKNIGVTRKESHQAQQIAGISPEKFEEYIENTKTKEKELTKAGILRVARKERNKSIETPKLPKGKYRVIYADPPWQYSNVGFEQSAESNYPTMATDKICNLSIQDLTGEKAVLFLWVTNAFLKEGLRVCNSWGFEYKTNLVWIKKKGPTIGWFSKSRHELLFIATKGSGMHPQKKFKSFFEASVKQHSQKPEIIYQMIERMYPGPYLELFARQKREKWEHWGNEISKS